MLPRSFNKVRRHDFSLTSLSTICFRTRLTTPAHMLVTAREYRTKRVREARDEAKKEIEDYRKQKEEEFKKFESEHAAGNKQAEDEANKEAETKITEIKSAGKKGQDKVVADLLKAVFEVKPVPPTTA
ncbi:V-type proton ATPase subunit G [Pestalotiopsis fici W106-1]|uniref:V-type proton ATPase subunit G n=1 Tax=Pestalotiopsis fici (strain W106-1 / CGMCC3.15140) TaxID=1229662 RepID=W3XFE5_PESFW|nr:V-type proton ATPase subunit G [Pestalotiopsis fici W106-1]ETS84152.1 V-type proton ATPase subunit G [Pestalotiopsis fici W106-1]